MKDESKRPSRLHAYLCTLGLISLGTALPGPVAAEELSKPFNVLFLAIDDLRPQTGAYGYDYMKTPHMDRLAAEGRLFNRHYVQVPVCGASRYSLLTGQLPVSAETHRDNHVFKLFERGDAPTSLPQWFRENGYHTVQTGKVSHSPDGYQWRRDGYRYFRTGDAQEMPGAWDELITPAGQWETPWFAFFGYAGGDTRREGYRPAVEMADVDDTGYPDALLAEAAIEKLGELARKDQPFFYAVGLYKPHLPFTAPKKYWDLYDRDTIDMTDVDLSRRGGGEMWNYAHRRSDLDDPNHAKKLRHGYFASVSYVDAQVGKILEALETHGLRDNTIVVLWGDHGFHLGEGGHWGKQVLYEYAMRSALIVRAPGMPQAGVANDSIISSIDIYPTLVELASLPMPEHLDGKSLLPILRDPSVMRTQGALGFWRDGVTLRTDRYRLIDNRVYETEKDPSEENNIAGQHPELLKKLQQQRDKLLDASKAQN